MEFCIGPRRQAANDDGSPRITALIDWFKEASLEKSCSPTDHIVDMSCFNCSKQASLTCSSCGEARYCSQPCQKMDWHLHKPLCKTFHAFAADKAPEPKNGNEWYRAIIFPHDDPPNGTGPEWIWLRKAGIVFKASPHRSFAGLAPLISPPANNHIITQIVNTAPRFAALHPNVGHVLLDTSLGDVELSLRVCNDSIVKLCGTRGHAMMRFGPVVVSAFTYPDAHLKHVTLRDFRLTATYFRTHHHNPVVIGDPAAFPGRTAAGLKLNCVARSRLEILSADLEADDQWRLFLMGMGDGNDIEEVCVPIEDERFFSSFQSAFPAQLGLNWWVRPGGCVWSLDVEHYPLPMTPNARFILNILGEEEAGQAGVAEVQGRQDLGPETSPEVSMSRNEANSEPACVEEESPVSQKDLAVNGAVLVFRPDGGRIYPAHLLAMNDYIASIGSLQPASKFTRGGFEAFWWTFKERVERAGISMEGVPSPYQDTHQGE